VREEAGEEGGQKGQGQPLNGQGPVCKLRNLVGWTAPFLYFERE
jgi:hypothetical protein